MPQSVEPAKSKSASSGHSVPPGDWRLPIALAPHHVGERRWGGARTTLVGDPARTGGGRGALVAKTGATAIAIASRFGSGIFSPALYLGAMTGGAFGMIAASAFPQVGSSEGLYAILGMGAVAAAVLGAPISTTVMVFELTGGFALSLALLLTVSIGNGIFQAILGRSFFQAQLASRGVVLQDGPHRVLMKSVRVAHFMQVLAEGEADTLPEAERELALRADDSLETALRVFDTSGADRLGQSGEGAGLVQQGADRVECRGTPLIWRRMARSKKGRRRLTAGAPLQSSDTLV